MPVAPQPSNIRASGGDYSDISSWWVDVPATLTQEQRALIRGTITQTGGIGLTSRTTTSTFKVVLQGDAGFRHTGIAGSGAKITGTLGVIRTALDFFEVDALEIEGTDGNVALLMSRAGGTNSIKVTRSILTSSGSPLGANDGNSNYIIRNNIIYATGAARTYDSRGAATLEFSNNIVYSQGGDFPFLHDGGHVIKNNYVGGGTNKCYNSTGSYTGSNNASSDTTATQFSSSINSIAGSTAFTSVTAGSEDFRTKTGFTGLTDLGVTIAAVTDDCLGNARPQGSAYDIGPFENIASSYPTFSITGVGAQALQSAAALSSVGLGTVTVKAAASLTSIGIGASAILSAARISAAGVGTLSALAASALSSVGVGAFNATPGSIFPTFSIAGVGAQTIKAAMKFSPSGLGGFNPQTGGGTTFVMRGACATVFLGPGWRQVADHTNAWTLVPPVVTSWSSPSLLSNLWTRIL